MKSLHINLPTELQSNPFLLRNNVQVFVIDAIKEKIERSAKNDFDALLAEGYKASSVEDLSVLKDFENADFENL